MGLSAREKSIVGAMALVFALCLGYLVIGMSNLRRHEAAARLARPPRHIAVPLRIASLSPAVSIILTDLGHPELIVGRDKSDMAAAPSVLVCADFPNIDYEALNSVEPTHVILQGGDEPTPTLAQQAAKSHWVLRSYPLLTLDDIRHATAALYALTSGATPDGVPEAPHPVLARMDAAWSPREPDLAAAGRILLLESIDPPAALGPGSFHHQILERMGGTSAITEGKPYITLDLEDIRRLAPDGIILFRPRAPGSPEPATPATVEGIRAMLGRIATLQIPAMAHGRVALIDDPLCLTPSTAMIGVADRMAEIIEAWRVDR
jgi:ABC-type Fe3+-hydroxamate transport system substrate-binding protein